MSAATATLPPPKAGSMIYAMRALQRGMVGEWENAGIFSDDDVMQLVKDVRDEIESR